MLASVAGPVLAQHAPPSSAPPVVRVGTDDVAMRRAIAAARAALPDFAARLRSPRRGDAHFAVKVAAPVAGGTEHVWLVGVALGRDSLRGRLDNDPEDLPGWRAGDGVAAPLSAVTDWMFVERGVLRGAYTTRVLLARMPAAERRRVLAAMGVRID